jgi:class 3 adenylate cyclase
VVNLKQLNDMCLKFVPKEFLTQIDKNSINKVSLGDYTEKNMTISYTNLEFSSIWENEISAEQEYTLFSNCVSLIYPIIKKHNGYIAKIISQNIICLFSKHPSDAINCTMEITTELEKYMNQLNNESLVLKKSTGIHYGKMVLGTIGEEGRLDDTVISESVSLVARLSAVARNMGINFLFSDTFYNLISENNYDFAQLGQTVIKGKSQPITIYTCSKKRKKINEN